MTDGLSTADAAFVNTDRQPMSESSPGYIPALSFDVPAPPLSKRDSTTTETAKDEVSTFAERLATFVGPNCEAYLDYYRDTIESGNGGPLKHWHWIPFAFSVPWMFLRRRYRIAIGSAALPIILGYLLPRGAGIALSVGLIALACGLTGRYWYIRTALNKVREIEGRRLWPVQRDERLRNTGGVSLLGAIFGSVLWGAIVIAPYFADWMP